MPYLLPLLSTILLVALLFATSRLIELKTGRSAMKPSEAFFAFYLVGCMVLGVVLVEVGATGLWSATIGVGLFGVLLLVGQVMFGRNVT